MTIRHDSQTKRDSFFATFCGDNRRLKLLPTHHGVPRRLQMIFTATPTYRTGSRHDRRQTTTDSKPAATRGIVLAAALATAMLTGPAGATPSAEYGPEVEARFIERCAASGGAEIECSRFLEGVQARLGYPRFLELAATMTTLPDATETRFASSEASSRPAP
jgi:hypothetical protein